MSTAAAAINWSTPATTRNLVIAVAVGITSLWLVYFWWSYRRNLRQHAPNGLTPTERQLSGSHAVAIVVAVLLTMGLAIGAVVSPTVNEALSKVGDHSRVIPVIVTPLLGLYIRWFGRKVVRSSHERARAGH